jgi:hypothetical protein
MTRICVQESRRVLKDLHPPSGPIGIVVQSSFENQAVWLCGLILQLDCTRCPGAKGSNLTVSTLLCRVCLATIIILPETSREEEEALSRKATLGDKTRKASAQEVEAKCVQNEI